MLAQYAVSPGVPTSPAIDDRLTIGPAAPRGAARPHGRERVLAPEEDAVDVHRLHAPPLLERRVDDRAQHLDARVVHQDVEPAEAREGLRHRGLPGGFVTHVVVREGGLDAGVGERGGRCPPHIVEHVGDQDGRASRTQRPGARRADAARGAGDERDLAVETQGGKRKLGHDASSFGARGPVKPSRRRPAFTPPSGRRPV